MYIYIYRTTVAASCDLNAPRCTTEVLRVRLLGSQGPWWPPAIYEKGNITEVLHLFRCYTHRDTEVYLYIYILCLCVYVYVIMCDYIYNYFYIFSIYIYLYIYWGEHKSQLFCCENHGFSTVLTHTLAIYQCTWPSPPQLVAIWLLYVFMSIPWYYAQTSCFTHTRGKTHNMCTVHILVCMFSPALWRRNMYHIGGVL